MAEFDISELLIKIEKYLDETASSKWSSANTLIQKLNLQGMNAAQLDSILVEHYQGISDSKIRFSTLPAKNSLDVLWGHINRVKKREVSDIYKQNTAILVDELDRVKDKNMFISHSFKDSAIVIDLAKKLARIGIHAWLAETDILQYDHINQKVREAIEALPYFGVFLSENLLKSVWSAKEIGFALNRNKVILGFVDTRSPLEFEDIHVGTRVSQEIYRRFFDNQTDVRFFPYPDTEVLDEKFVKWDSIHKISKEG